MLNFLTKKGFLGDICLILLSFSLALLTACHNQQNSTSDKQALPSTIQQLIKHEAPNVNIGIAIKRLSDDRLLYAEKAQHLFLPASNLKLFTAAGALLSLGPQFRYQTKLLTNARHIRQQQLTGNIYLVFSGDPSLSYDDLYKLLSQLKKYDVKHITGHVNLVASANSLSSGQHYPPGWMVDDKAFAYATANTPYLLDGNALKISVNPASKTNHRALIAIAEQQPERFIKIINHVRTAAKHSACKINYITPKKDSLILNGCISQGEHADLTDIAITDPKTYLASRVASILKILNIHYAGRVRFSERPQHARTLFVHVSKPLTDLLHPLLKDSDNLYAESLFLHIGQKLPGTQANHWAHAAKALKSILKLELGLDLTKANISDGSGLSRYDQVSPLQIVNLLSQMYHYFPLSYEYINALPVQGRDGTLKHRLLPGEVGGWIRAKTGSMQSVSSLSGYFMDRKGERYAFAIMINGFSDKLKHYRHLQDQIMAYFSLGITPQINSTPSTAQQPIAQAEEVLRSDLTDTYIDVVRSDKQLRIILPSEFSFTKSHQVAPSVYGALNRIAESLQQTPNALIEISGFYQHPTPPQKLQTTTLPSRTQSVSSQQAEAVANYLINRGVNKNQIFTVGFGAQMPLTQYSTQYRNRVEISITNTDVGMLLP